MGVLFLFFFVFRSIFFVHDKLLSIKRRFTQFVVCAKLLALFVRRLFLNIYMSFSLICTLYLYIPIYRCHTLFFHIYLLYHQRWVSSHGGCTRDRTSDNSHFEIAFAGHRKIALPREIDEFSLRLIRTSCSSLSLFVCVFTLVLAGIIYTFHFIIYKNIISKYKNLRKI